MSHNHFANTQGGAGNLSSEHILSGPNAFKAFLVHLGKRDSNIQWEPS
jgi:hypothetical protein